MLDIRLWPAGALATEFEPYVHALVKRLVVPAAIRTTNPFAPPFSGAVTVLFVDPQRPLAPSLDAQIAAFLDGGGILVPCAEEPAGIGQVLAAVPSVGAINVFMRKKLFGSWCEALADEVVRVMWQKRPERRVFISYKRTDSSAIAHQLFEELTKLGFQVFLDEASVETSRNFQGELMWWLNDADLMLLLASPRLDSSRWVLEEINFAQTHNLGVLAVEWPAAVYASPPSGFGAAPLTPPAVLAGLMADERLVLGAADVNDATFAEPDRVELTKEGLRHVLQRAFEQRTVGIRARLVDLVRSTERHLRQHSPSSPALGDLVWEQNSGGKSFWRVFPFRPTPSSIHRLALDASEAQEAVAVYAEDAPDDPRAQALRWVSEASRNTPAGNQLTMALRTLPRDF